jgi:FkbM family methyltransferase
MDKHSMSDNNLTSFLSDEFPRLISAALASPASREALMRHMPLLVAEYDRYHNWNNIDINTNGERWFARKVAPRSKCIVDVGANIGEWTQMCLSLNQHSDVYCFEANPATAHILANRFQAVSNVQVFPFGLGEQDAILDFHDHGQGSGLSGFVSRERSAGLSAQRIIQVPCKRITDIADLARRDVIDLIKIDTEGFEMPILASMRPWLATRKVRLIQFEYGGTWIDAREYLADAFALFHEHGYKVGRLMPEAVAWIERFDHRLHETFKYSNFVACSSPNDVIAYQLDRA